MTNRNGARRGWLTLAIRTGRVEKPTGFPSFRFLETDQGHREFGRLIAEFVPDRPGVRRLDQANETLSG